MVMTFVSSFEIPYNLIMQELEDVLNIRLRLVDLSTLELE